jgi:hypothetical protein
MGFRTGQPVVGMAGKSLKAKKRTLLYSSNVELPFVSPEKWTQLLVPIYDIHWGI